MNTLVKRIGCLCAAALIGFVAMGMGSMGSEDATRIPEVDVNYAATVVDQSDVSMMLHKLSFAGRTFLMGRLGKARVSVEFEKIRSVIFGLHNNDLRANVRLKNGELIEIVIEKKEPFFGESDFAQVRIEAQDIKTIVFQGRVQGRN